MKGALSAFINGTLAAAGAVVCQFYALPPGWSYVVGLCLGVAVSIISLLFALKPSD